MSKFKRKIVTAIATGALLLNTLTPFALASTTLQITGNGSSSENSVEVETKNETTIVQNNDAKIHNDVEAEAETGDNEANNNTGGDVTIDTGNATSETDVSNVANLNKADVSNCGSCQGDSNVVISGNGSGSENEVELETESENEIYQDNKADIHNNVEAEAETGDNEANNNTGGDVTVKTGDANSSAKVSSTANANVASVGGNNSGNGNGSVSAQIIGNGSNSENEIELEFERETTIVQNNDAKIHNDVEAEAETGDNEANNNTGGDVTIDTGNAIAMAEVNNLVNFNSAQVDCCLLDVDAKISGNGADSENEIEAELENELEVFQGDEKSGNDADLHNKIEAEAETGENDAEANTGPVGDDPVDVMTGDAESTTNVLNEANANIFGSGEESELSDLLEDLDLDFEFNLGMFLSFLHHNVV